MLKRIVCGLVVAFAFGTPAWAQEHVNVKIGLVANLDDAEAGESLLSGVRLGMIDTPQFKASIDGAPAKFRLFVLNDRGSRDTAKDMAKQMVEDGVMAVIGHLSTATTMAASGVYEAGGVLQVVPVATSMGIKTDVTKGLFRLATNDAVLGFQMGAKAASSKGSKRVLIISEKNFYGNSVAPKVEEGVVAAGGVVAGKFLAGNEMDVLADLPKLRQLQFDAMVMVGFGEVMHSYSRGVRRSGSNAAIFMTEGLCTEDVLKASMEGGQYVCAKNGQAKEKLRMWPAFIDRYRAQFGKSPDVYAAHGYDAVKVLAAAVTATGSAEPRVVAKKMVESSLLGVTGELSFDARGELKHGSVSFMEAKNGGWLVLD